MVEEQIYNPIEGINRMVADVESFVSPLVYKYQIVLRIIGMLNLPLVLGVFGLLVFYLVAKRKHSLKSKLIDPKNYYFLGAMLLIYIFLADNPIRLGPAYNISLGLIVMPVAAKKLGPLIAGGFGIIQYGAGFILHSNEPFGITTMLVAAISGMLYGWILYARPTSYFRCLWAKVSVNILCNVILVPLITVEAMVPEVAEIITSRIVSNILLAPIQAAVIYFAIIGLKKIEKINAR